jgi:acetylornithine deacetylase/succinyl-diaminopimelate desuccinylase-like protein
MLDSKLPAKILSELVSLPSVYPTADAGGTTPGEARMAGWVADYLRRLGADVELRELSKGRPNVVAVFEPVGKARRTVMFAPHLDTVGVSNMTVPPFAVTEKSGRLYGRGCCDTKGPTAALFSALECWSRSASRRSTDVRWTVVATAGEEQGSLGAEFLCKHNLQADFGIALEPTDLKVVAAGKGVLRVRITTAGRAAHGSAPQRGSNAIYKMLPLLEELRGKIARKLAACKHPVLGKATINLGTLAGGGELNVVPAQCAIGLDFRTHPDCTSEAILKLLARSISRCAPGAKMEIIRDRPAFVADPANEWARRLRRVSKGWAAADWFCDANIFNNHGIPAVAFGPGSINQAHTKDEFIAKRSLTEGANAFLRFLLSPPI